MSQELLYTSAPTGLKSGSRGFATVLCTAGMASNISTRLETLSGYRHVFAPQDPQASLNPVSWSHLRLTINGQPTSILSRIAAYGVDYSGRTNKLAHHVVPAPTEMTQAGPAWLLLQSSWVRSDWDGSCQTPPSGPALPSGNQPVAICQRWQQTTGDAGWGGVLAETIASPTSKPLWIIFSIDQSNGLLSLINESIALMPVSQRWRATFSTYYTNLPPEIDCKIRCVLVGTEEATLAPARGTVIDLTKNLTSAPDSAYVETARTGDVTATVIAPMPASLGGHPRSSMSSPLEVIDGDPLWPDELSLQPPAVLGKPPGLAMVNNPNVPPQLPKAAMAAIGKDGGSKRFLWTTAVSGLAIILLLSAAIPVILATKKRTDGITELAANGTNAEQGKQPTSKGQPERKINFGQDEPSTTANTSNTDLVKSGTASTHNVGTPTSAPAKAEEKNATTQDPKLIDPPGNADSNTDEENASTSPEAPPPSGNSSNTTTPSVLPDNLSPEEAITKDNTMPTGDAPSVVSGTAPSPAVKHNLPALSDDDQIRKAPTITAVLRTDFFFTNKGMRFDFSQDLPISNTTGFFYSKTDDIAKISLEEKRLDAEKTEFKDESIRLIVNLKMRRTSVELTGSLYVLSGMRNPETEALLKLGEELLIAHRNILEAKELFNKSGRVTAVPVLSTQQSIESPLLLFDEIESKVSESISKITTFLANDKIQESEKSIANANAVLLGKISTNINAARSTIHKINQTMITQGYLVFNISKSVSPSLLITGQTSSSEVHPITFKLQIPE